MDETPSGTKLLFDLLGIQSVLFGVNAFNLLMLIYHLIRLKFQIRHSKLNLVFIHAILSIGFLFHVGFIFSKIIYGELVQSQHFEMINSIRMPEVVFCLDFELPSNKSTQGLSGNDLQNLTNDLRLETVFHKIIYLNGSNYWIELKSPDFRLSDEFSIEVLYFLGMKCFYFRLQKEYAKRQFGFTNEAYVLKVIFNRTNIQEQRRLVYFFTAIRSTMQFSKLNLLDFRSKKSQHCNQELLDYKLEDNFLIIKQPLWMFYEQSDEYDVDRYITKLLKNFPSAYNSTTLLIPLDRARFQYRINDSLFNQYWRTFSEQSTVANYNFERQYPSNHLREEQNSLRAYNAYDFQFGLIFLKKVIFITNEDNWISLILDLLSVCFIWYDLGLLQFPDLASKAKHHFVLSVKWLAHKLSRLPKCF